MPKRPRRWWMFKNYVLIFVYWHFRHEREIRSLEKNTWPLEKHSSKIRDTKNVRVRFEFCRHFVTCTIAKKLRQPRLRFFFTPKIHWIPWSYTPHTPHNYDNWHKIIICLLLLASRSMQTDFFTLWPNFSFCERHICRGSETAYLHHNNCVR